MKKYAFIIVLLLVMGCVPKFTIPDEPKYKEIYIYPMNGMICFDKEGWGILLENLKMDKNLRDEMRKILERIRK